MPTLLGGLPANATEPAGAAAPVGALEQHRELVEGEGAADVDKVDIVDNVFGSEQHTVITALSATEGTGGDDLVAELLPMLAPIVMAYLAEQLAGGGGSTAAPPGHIRATYSVVCSAAAARAAASGRARRSAGRERR
ncbi:DUF937 domain-containing protein [Nocardia sp. CA-119907]|uniref:DUF937 domain-containing protein n=1 Tax=Nocardia sp. CA-119907 TaxID=3239973 RepID=UPI003D95B145